MGSVIFLSENRCKRRETANDEFGHLAAEHTEVKRSYQEANAASFDCNQ